MAMEDYFFKTPVSIPFKWEIRPGVPKAHHHHQQQPPSTHHHSHSFLHQEQQSTNHNRSSPTTPQKLTPPPAGFTFQPSSVLSVPRARSQRNRFILAQPEIVSAGCFTRPVEKKKKKKKKNKAPKLTFESEPETDYKSDVETLSRWSVSTRKSLSPFRDSPSSYRSSPRLVTDAEWASSYRSSPRLVTDAEWASSYRSSPRLISDAEWAGFGLF